MDKVAVPLPALLARSIEVDIRKFGRVLGANLRQFDIRVEVANSSAVAPQGRSLWSWASVRTHPEGLLVNLM